jgi:hypothetical protein
VLTLRAADGSGRGRSAQGGESGAFGRGGRSVRVRLRAGASREFVVPGDAPVTPTADLARGRVTFPTSPLPAGMGEPARAVDGDPRTAWRPGPAGRMVVDLGAAHDVTSVGLTWTSGRRRSTRIETSTDGLTYTTVAESLRPTLTTVVAARYLAVAVVGWRPGDAELVALTAT